MRGGACALTWSVLCHQFGLNVTPAFALLIAILTAIKVVIRFKCSMAKTFLTVDRGGYIVIIFLHIFNRPKIHLMSILKLFVDIIVNFFEKGGNYYLPL